MKNATRGLILCALITLWSGTGRAAPLFPDIPEQHWGRDAVATLSAKGLVEGYPDGTFKGDRAMSRWEVATVVARFLAQTDSLYKTFATKSEKAELKKLVEALSEELEALGVRTESLEEAVGRLDERVTELERISFYGSLDTRVVFQSFKNDGVGDNDSLRGGTGAPGGVGFLNYDNVIGARIGSILRPQIHGVIPVVDYRNGRALTNGTGFTSLARLGVHVLVTEDIEAGLELAGYTSQGDRVVDAYWGTTAPYVANPFSALPGNGQSLGNAPFTRMVLDRFWMTHTPTNTSVTVGAIENTSVDSFVFSGQPNLGVFGARRWPGVGFQVSGEVELSEDAHLEYEVLGTRFGNGVRFGGQSYQNRIMGGTLGYFDENARLQANYVRISEEAPSGGGPLTIGLTNGLNTAYGNSAGWTPRHWVNPPGFFAAQSSASQQLTNGTLPNTTDTRPVVGWNGNSDDAIGVVGGGNLGPQSQATYGVSGHYDFHLNEHNVLTLGGEYGHSDYRPNRNSSYSSTGDMLRVRLDAQLADEDLELGVEYLSVDPTYNPASWFGNVAGLRAPLSFGFVGAFHLHDFAKYPHNREGLRLRAKYNFFQGSGSLWAKAGFLDQTRTSLYDVRVTANALGANTPTGDVIGFSPGFIDPIFQGFAHPSLFGTNSRNSFSASLQPLENPNGSQNDFAAGVNYNFRDAGVKLRASYRQRRYLRRSGLSAQLGGSQNHVDIRTEQFAVGADWDFQENMTLKAGLDIMKSGGHIDPAGLYNSYALATGQTDFKNIDSVQTVPHLGLDWNLSETSDVEFMARYYDTDDQVDPSIAAGLSNAGQIGSSVHPFSWSGLQLSTHYSLKF